VQITTVGFEKHDWGEDSRDDLGGDLVLTTTLPETKAYKINVDMPGSYTGDYEVQVNILSE
jgi:hypothetical protein